MKRTTDRLWAAFAWLVSRPRIADWIIRRSKRTPYFNLDGYMDRDWVFNPYDKARSSWWRNKLPSARVHHILRADTARHPHDHPWDARTIVLRNHYREERMIAVGSNSEVFQPFLRREGDTATLRYGEYHTITDVPENGVWTLFITWGYRGTWGFWVDGRKIPHREYTQTY